MTTDHEPPQAGARPIPEPLSDETLDEFRYYVATNYYTHDAAGAFHDVARLLAEVDRLRADLAARDEIVRAVAAYPPESQLADGSEFCHYCDSADYGKCGDLKHSYDCAYRKARALLATGSPSDAADGASGASGAEE